MTDATFMPKCVVGWKNFPFKLELENYFHETSNKHHATGCHLKSQNFKIS